MKTARSAIKTPRRFHTFMRRTTISHFSFLISNFSFKQSFQTESKGEPPHRLIQHPSFFPFIYAIINNTNYSIHKIHFPEEENDEASGNCDDC